MTLRRLWLSAYLVFLMLGSSWAMSSPLLSSPDEPAHLVKSAAVVRGQLTGSLMKIADEGPGSLFLATAFACARTSRSSSPLALGVVILITPMVLFLIGSLNPNGLEILAAVTFWTAFGTIVSGRAGNWSPRSVAAAW